MITLRHWRDTMADTISQQFTERGFPLAFCGELDPAELVNNSGQPIILTPAVILYRGPFTIRLHDRGLAKRCYDATRYQWEAYCIESTRNPDPLLAADDMANLVRAIVLEYPDWGLGKAVREPELEDMVGEQIDIKLPGHVCRVFRWQQSAGLVGTYT